MSQSEFYANMAGVTGMIVLTGLGIYWLIRWIVMAIIRACSQPDETEPEPQSDPIDDAKSELLADAAAKELQLNLELIDAVNRMNDAASDCKDDVF